MRKGGEILKWKTFLTDSDTHIPKPHNTAAVLALNVNLVHCPCFQTHVILLDLWNRPSLENSVSNVICKYRWNDLYFLAEMRSLDPKPFFGIRCQLATPSWMTTFLDILVAKSPKPHKFPQIPNPYNYSLQWRGEQRGPLRVTLHSWSTWPVF